jgi:hypothetical protein
MTRLITDSGQVLMNISAKKPVPLLTGKRLKNRKKFQDDFFWREVKQCRFEFHYQVGKRKVEKKHFVQSGKNQNLRRKKMKKLLALTTLAVMLGWLGTFEAAAQEQPNAKDMYTTQSGGNSSNARYQGAKITVRLKRGNQPERIVSTNETFYSSDKIKLIFDINFSGYAAIINVGPTGNETLLFPYLDGSNRIVSHRVTPNAGTQLPRGDNWIVFDGRTGSEQITVIFSKTPIPGLESYEGTVAATTTGSGGNSNVRIAGETEADRILAELNSKNLLGSNSKDLTTQTGGDGTYSVAQNGLGREPVAFTFYLKHR